MRTVKLYLHMDTLTCKIFKKKPHTHRKTGPGVRLGGVGGEGFSDRGARTHFISHFVYFINAANGLVTFVNILICKMSGY